MNKRTFLKKWRSIREYHWQYAFVYPKKNYHWPHLELKDHLRSDSEELKESRRPDSETVQRMFKLLWTLIYRVHKNSSHPLPDRKINHNPDKTAHVLKFQ